jgi:hypothetical protein
VRPPSLRVADEVRGRIARILADWGMSAAEGER